jgi:hypothetical protein
VNVGWAAGPGELSLADDVVDDLIDSMFQPVLVLADQIDHVVRDRDRRVVSGHLEVPVGAADLDDVLVTEHERDGFPSADVYRGQVERLDRTGGLRAGLRRQSEQDHGGNDR